MELPDDRNKLSPRYSSSQELGDDVTTDRVSGGGNVELNSFRVRESQTSNTEGANQLISSLARTRQQSVQKSVENAAGHSGSSASTPQNLFSRYATALKQSGMDKEICCKEICKEIAYEEERAEDAEEDEHNWAAGAVLMAIAGVVLYGNRKDLYGQIKNWRHKWQTNTSKVLALRKVHKENKTSPRQELEPAIASSEVVSSAFAATASPSLALPSTDLLKPSTPGGGNCSDVGVMELTACERIVPVEGQKYKSKGGVAGPTSCSPTKENNLLQVLYASGPNTTQMKEGMQGTVAMRKYELPSEASHNLPESAQMLSSLVSHGSYRSAGWRWRPHVLLGRG